jgi:hypothetical protein
VTAARFRFQLAGVSLSFVLAGIAAGGCGKKGPPLAPLHMVPASPTDVSVVRRGVEARLRFTVPATSPNGPGRVDLDRVEVYAVTVAPGDAAPSDTLLLTKKYLAGTIPVKPLPVEDAPAQTPPPQAAPDTRPGPGDAATFTEQLTPEKLTPAVLPKSPPPPPSATATPTPSAESTNPQRIYVVRGMTRSGRSGAPSSRVALPLAAVPAPPTGVAVPYTEAALTIEWTPPAPDAAGRTLTFNVYRKGVAAPLNGTPLAEPTFERAGPEFETVQCFSVRTVVTAGGVPIESDPSDEQCVTPRDTFPPAAPKGLAAVAVPGELDLIWDANAEPDLAGYVILRGEAPGDKLLPLMTAPLAETKFADKTVKPGVRYVYAAVAVDKASNLSAQSAHIEEIAR